MFITITIIIMAMPMIIIIITIPHYSAAGSRRSQTTSVKVASQGTHVARLSGLVRETNTLTLI